MASPKKKFSRNAPCPCGSGKKYKNCCYHKGFDWLEDGQGNVFRSVPLSDDLAQMLDQQRQKFVERYGREPEADDKLFFDAPPFEHMEHHVVEAMKKAGVDPAFVYAFEETGLLVSDENQHLISDADLAKWHAAVEKYRVQHGDHGQCRPGFQGQ